MKTIKIIFIFLIALLVACTEKERQYEDEMQQITLSADIEQNATTKTSLSGPVSGRWKTLWSEDDVIGVFTGENPACPFTLKSGAGTSRAEFSGVYKNLDGSKRKIAIYPCSIISDINDNSSVVVVLPAEQQYTIRNIAEGSFPMVAVTDDTELNFKNLCSAIKVSITGDLSVDFISFSANDGDIKVSGTAIINPDIDSPTLSMTQDGSSYVKLVCPSIKLSEEATDFYIVVPSQKYSNGFSLTISTDKGLIQKTITSDVTLLRSELYRITPFECKIDEDNKNIIFEDANFKSYLISKFDKDADGEISYDEALNIKIIDVNTDYITSLSGIEHMSNLRSLYCYGSVKLNNATQEYEKQGVLKKLDLSKNINLINLEVLYNQISSLNVSKNTLLSSLKCDMNELTSLDVSNNPNLTHLFCGDNNLTTLKVGENLTYLRCNGNNLSTLDLSNTLNLKYLDCYNNNLTTLDISKNSNLTSIDCYNNYLTTLDVSKNPNLTNLRCDYNEIEFLDLSSLTDLKGLDCFSNKLTSLDVSNNPNLTDLYCSYNNLTKLDVSGNPNLSRLLCYSNKLSSIDVRNNHNLVTLYCWGNSLTDLDVSKNPNITDLHCGKNKIESLDISALTILEKLFCNDNPLITLYVYNGQIDKISSKDIPSTTNIVVGSEPSEDEVFTVTPSLFDIDGKEQDISMTVTANMDYSVNSMPEWIRKKSENSGAYTFTVSANTASAARSGDIVFKNVNNSLLTVAVKQGIQAYTSTDYNQDGQVSKIHSATVGKGIDVVFVGDAFADKDQELFNKYVELGKEAFFTEEPFKSTKDRFNIYRIGSVSKNGIISQEGGDTKFSSQFGQGTHIEGDNEAIFSFVSEKLPSVDLKKTIIFVIINKVKYAGTCHMYSNNQAICYVPLCKNETEYAQTLRHEGCGHGFGKLADEYFYSSQGTIPTEMSTQLKQWQGISYGFYENVDLTSDPNTIKWSRLIADSRYSGNVGVYQGGYTYPYGVYRPTENSIMRYNTGGFNAPSREAIYKKIMKFSEGDTWTYDYETFVAFDAPARSTEAVTKAAAQSTSVDKSNFIPLAPPVMIMVNE